MENTPVISIPFNKNYLQAIHTIFEHFPTVKNQIKDKKIIFISGYLDHHYSPYLYSDTMLLKKLCEYLRQLNPKIRIYITFNTILGFCTRLFINLSPIRSQLRGTRARFLYLDEKATVKLMLGQDDRSYAVNFPKILVDKLIKNRDQALYINVSPLKTHHHLKFAGSLFHQLRFLNPSSHEFIHSNAVHRTIVDLYDMLKPDLTIINAIEVVSHGILPSHSRIDSYAHVLNTLLASIDPLAADIAALKLINQPIAEIIHLKSAQSLTYPDANPRILGNLPQTQEKILSSITITDLPHNLDIIIGKNRSNIDHQLGLVLHYIQILHEDLGGYTDFSIVVGNDFQASQFDHIHEPVVVLGAGTCEEAAPMLNSRYREIYFIDACHDLRHLIGVLLKIMRVSSYNLFGTNPIRAWSSVLIARLKGSTYHFPSAPGYLRRRKTPQANS